MTRPRLALLAPVAAVAAFLATPASAAEPPAYAMAGFGVVGDAHTGFLVRFSVRRGFVGTVTTTDMVSEVFRCSLDDGSCAMVAQQIDVLHDSAFVLRKDLSATLRTTWAGKPLVIDWRGVGIDRGATTGHSYTVVGTNHTETAAEYRLAWTTARASSLLGGGRGCSDRLSIAMIGTAAVAEDAVARLGTHPRAETVTGLAAHRGKGYS